jgi:anti-anti-sigma factor
MTHEHVGTGPVRAQFSVDGTTVLVLRGDIDIATAPLVTACLDALTAVPHPDLVVDLSPVSFLDCSGLNVLCRARRRTRARHGRLRLVSGGERLRVVLRLTGLADAFEIHPSLPDALRPACPTPRTDGFVPAVAPSS